MAAGLKSSRLMRIVTGAFALAACAFQPGAASAQAYPTKPVTLISTGAAGGGGDLVARTLGDYLSKRWGQPVVIENHSGLAAPLTAIRAPADGYTLFLSDASMATNQVVLRTPPPEPSKIWAPISLIAIIDFAIVVPNDSKLKTVQDLISAAKANPGRLNYSSAGVGTPQHLMAELFKHQAGIDVLHIPYRGSPAAATAVLSGRSDFGFQSISASAAQVKGGQLRWLASTSLKRNATTPDLPTISEAGVPGYQANSWWAIQVRAEVPREIQEELSRALVEAVKDPSVNRRLLDMGLDPVGSSPAEYASFLQEQISRWKALPDGVIPKQD